MKLALDWIADQRIEAARERGELRNLPGEGRPLELEEDGTLSAEARFVMRRMMITLKSSQDDAQHFARSIALLRLKRQRAAIKSLTGATFPRIKATPALANGFEARRDHAAAVQGPSEGAD